MLPASRWLWLQKGEPSAKRARPNEQVKPVKEAKSKDRKGAKKAGKAASKTTKFDELVKPALLPVSYSGLSFSSVVACMHHAFTRSTGPVMLHVHKSTGEDLAT